jgi:hypothetical protein
MERSGIPVGFILLLGDSLAILHPLLGYKREEGYPDCNSNPDEQQFQALRYLPLEGQEPCSHEIDFVLEKLALPALFAKQLFRILGCPCL